MPKRRLRLLGLRRTPSALCAKAYKPMRLEPPTPTRAPDDQFREV